MIGFLLYLLFCGEDGEETLCFVDQLYEEE
jgi:hypothetical protein